MAHVFASFQVLRKPTDFRRRIWELHGHFLDRAKDPVASACSDATILGGTAGAILMCCLLKILGHFYTMD